MSSPSLILFAHGARDPEWIRPFERLRDAVLAHEPQRHVQLAFLEFMAPTLVDAIDQAVASGASAITIVPVFLAQGGHVKRDVPVMLQAARDRHPHVSILLRSALGESQSVIEAMALCVVSGEAD